MTRRPGDIIRHAVGGSCAHRVLDVVGLDDVLWAGLVERSVAILLLLVWPNIFELYGKVE